MCSAKILIDPGALDAPEAASLLNSSADEVCIILKGWSKKKREFERKKERYIRALGRERVLLYMGGSTGEGPNRPYGPKNLDVIYQSILDDHQTFFLYDRNESLFHNLGFPLSTQLKSERIIAKIHEAINFHAAHWPSVICFLQTPHHMNSWIFARVAEMMGVEVRYLEQSILPWRFHLCSGLKSRAKVVPVRNFFPISQDQCLVPKFLESKTKGASIARPEYEAKRLRRQGNKYYSFYHDLVRWWKRPDLIAAKYSCVSSYRKKAVDGFLLESGSYVLFLLNWQPERTTLPDSFGFAQQLFAIRILKECLPENVSIVVKEHPSTFTNYCSWKVRDKTFYEEIIKAGAFLARMENDTYRLMDRSFCVATVNGTGSSEAIMRGKAALAFGGGRHLPLDLEWLHMFKSIPNLRRFLRSVSESVATSREALVDRLMQDVVYNSFSGLEEKGVQSFYPSSKDQYLKIAATRMIHEAVSY